MSAAYEQFNLSVMLALLSFAAWVVYAATLTLDVAKQVLTILYRPLACVQLCAW